MRHTLQRLAAVLGDPTGQCYAASEALYHALGRRGLTPHVMRLPAGSAYRTHWFLVTAAGDVIDPTVGQFPTTPDYSLAHGCGFLTRNPSRAARALLDRMAR